MADFTARGPELDKEVQEFVTWSKAEQESGRYGNDKPVEEGAAADWARSFEQERANVVAKVAEYLTARTRRLNELVDGMATVAGGGKDAAAIMLAATDGLATDATTILASVFSGVGRPSAKAQGLVLRAQLDEASFAKSLAGKGAADGWAKLVAALANVQRTTGEMKVAWDELAGEAEDLEKQAAERWPKLVEAVKAAAATAGRYPAVEAKLAAASDELAGAADAALLVTFDGESTEKLRDLKAKIDKAMGSVGTAAKELDDLEKELGDGVVTVDHAISFLSYLQDSEVGYVQRNYRRLHDMADELAKDPAPDRLAEQRSTDTKRLLADWSGSAGFPGMKADAEKVAGLLGAQTDAIAQTVKDAWGVLKKENDGRWIGKLTGTFRNQLLATEAWVGRRRDYDAVDLKGALQKLKDGAARGFGIDVDKGVGKVIDAVNSRPGTEKGRLEISAALDKQRKPLVEQLSSAKMMADHLAGRWNGLLGGDPFLRVYRRTEVEAV